MNLLRRFAVVCFAVAAAALLLRGQIATSLVVRGDELSYRNEPARAVSMYRRALLVDGKSGIAVDRIAFMAVRSNNPVVQAAIADLAGNFLAANPQDTRVRADYALLLLKLNRYASARAEFHEVALATGDARDFTFAGLAARRLGDRAGARREFSAALQADPTFVVARRDLERLQ